VVYLPHGAISSLTLGNGLQENYGYSGDRLQLTSVAASSNLLTLMYGYCGPGVTSCTNNNGNLQSQQMTRPNGSWTDTYSYDTVNRLTQGQETGKGSWTQAYGYDAYGNIAVTTNTGPPALTNETPTLLTQYNGRNQIGSWTYDASGNIMQVGTMARLFTYDAENRQLTASVAGIAGSSYVYDGDGRRVQKTTAWGSTTFVYDAFGQLAAEYGTPGDTGTKYLTADALGSTRLETAVGTSGPVVSQNYDYFPFGAEIGTGTAGRDGTFSPGAYPSAANGPSMKFTGKERDSESGLDYFGARYFSGAQGRFTGPDWSATPEPVPYATYTDPQTLNQYAYVRNNPLFYADVNGHCPDGCVAEGAFLVGAVLTAAVANYMAQPEAQRSMTNALSSAVDKVSSWLHPLPSTAADHTTGIPPTLDPGSWDNYDTGAPPSTSTGVVIGPPAFPSQAPAGIQQPIERRAGEFRPSTREGAIGENAESNGGTNKCENCGQDLVRAKNEKGQRPPGNQLQVHHDPPISKGGGEDSTPRVLCRDCHVEIHKQ